MTLSINSASMAMVTSLQSQSSTTAQAIETEQNQSSGPPAGGPPSGGGTGGPPPNGPPSGGNKETTDADLASLFEGLTTAETDADNEDETLTLSSESVAETGYSTALSLLSV
ncbi:MULTISPECIES: hypothetical protein [Pacificibacter]|uniref:hypothetical protein n=1 Tax=Pacificibacter TaxID=1042323 RepID=UPI001C09ED50|nr:MULTISPECIES: hypothetical protein [Pacificibacter]MBU2934846.1 hypothetical protein [Pacificibacter marinus]MDO6615820.1 hypothetical protein [Pacificibacter sp. 1_MG-2023]